MIKSSHFLKNGYTLIEALVYIAIFVIMSFTMISIILSIMNTSQEVSPLNSLSRGAVSSLEVITREIRSAVSVDIGGSVFGVPAGSLQLNTLDSAGNPKTVRFYLESGTVKVAENGVYSGPLTQSDVSATALIFNLATSTKQDLVKVELDLASAGGKYPKSEKFYSSVKLRTDN